MTTPKSFLSALPRPSPLSPSLPPPPSPGWYEGSRLSDGQKGWFPVSSVVEITNEHVRRRNLRERYRVMQAASQVANLAAAQGKAKTGP